MPQPPRADGADGHRDRAGRETHVGAANTHTGGPADWAMLTESLQSTVDHPMGPVIPGYLVLGELGRGGMGLVYKAKQLRLERIVALKVILTGAYASMIDRVRFRREAEAVAKLQHPNIVQIFDVGEAEGNSYMAMEYVDGGTLEKWQAGKPQSPRTSAALVAALARGVQHAHEHGVLHRDLKPANILTAKIESRSAVGEKASKLPFVPKITDFGLAKHLDGGMSLTATGVACGTPNYMPPEQVRKGAIPLGPPADVYALGGILYELLSGRPPFSGYSPAEIMTLVLSTDAVSLRFFRPDLPADVVMITERCLEKDPAMRYPSAADLADDLEKFAAGDPISIRPPTRGELARRWVKKNRRVAVAIAALAAGVFVLSLTSAVLLVAFSRTRADRDTLRADLATERAARETAEAALHREEDARRAADLDARKLFEKQSDAAVAHLKGLRTQRAGKLTEAEKDLSLAIDRFEALRRELDLRQPRSLKSELADAYLARGQIRLKLQKKADADLDFERALALDPDRMPALK